jgi:LysM repeat protein
MLRWIYVLLITACGAAPAQPVLNLPPAPYLTATPSLTPTPNVLVIRQTSVPSATPLAYTVQSGDTFSELAEQFKISQDVLRAANPTVLLNSMSVGTVLLIPAAEDSTARAATFTPAPVSILQTMCYPTADSGLWCFALIQNSAADALENISAQMTLRDAGGNTLASQTVFLPLDMLPAQASLPVYGFFPNLPAGANMQVQILSAIPSRASRFLPAALHNTLTQVDWNGLTAQLSGQISLPAESTAASQVWVAAVAYSKDGRVVGVTCWQGGSILPGDNIAFHFSVSSLSAPIDSVQLFVQAK